MSTGRDGPRYPPALTRAAHRELKRWAAVYARRDEVVRAAAAAGIGVNEITRTTGLAKTTILRILHPEP